MNKKLVAVAVAGVLAAPLAAQAQTANVTLYGRLNLTMEAVKGNAPDSNLPVVPAALAMPAGAAFPRSRTERHERDGTGRRYRHTDRCEPRGR